MKKMLPSLLALVMSLLLFGCGEDIDHETSTPTPAVESTPTPAPKSTPTPTKKPTSSSTSSSSSSSYKSSSSKSSTSSSNKSSSKSVQDEVNDWLKDQAKGKDYSHDDGGVYYCMGKNDTCPNKTHNAYDLYCDSCDPDGDNREG